MPTNIITHRCLHNRSKDSQFTCYVCAVPAILNEAVPATTQSVDAEIQSTLKSAYKYTGEWRRGPHKLTSEQRAVPSNICAQLFCTCVFHTVFLGVYAFHAGHCLMMMVMMTLFVTISIWHFSALIEEMHKRQPQEGPSIQLLKESLINTRQHEAFLRIILVRRCFNEIAGCYSWPQNHPGSWPRLSQWDGISVKLLDFV